MLQSNMIQSDLAEAPYLKQSFVPKIETGMRSAAAGEITYPTYALDKPIGYFFPEESVGKNEQQQLSRLEQQLLQHSRKLGRSDLHKLIAQAKALADLETSTRSQRTLCQNQAMEKWL